MITKEQAIKTFTKTLYVSAMMSYLEETKQLSGYQGLDLWHHLPPTPEAFLIDGERFLEYVDGVKFLAAMNAFSEAQTLSTKDEEDLLFCLVMEALNTGISWEDNYDEPHGLDEFVPKNLECSIYALEENDPSEPPVLEMDTTGLKPLPREMPALALNAAFERMAWARSASILSYTEDTVTLRIHDDFYDYNEGNAVTPIDPTQALPDTTLELLWESGPMVGHHPPVKEFIKLVRKAMKERTFCINL